MATRRQKIERMKELRVMMTRPGANFDKIFDEYHAIGKELLPNPPDPMKPVLDQILNR